MSHSFICKSSIQNPKKKLYLNFCTHYSFVCGEILFLMILFDYNNMFVVPYLIIQINVGIWRRLQSNYIFFEYLGGFWLAVLTASNLIKFLIFFKKNPLPVCLQLEYSVLCIYIQLQSCPQEKTFFINFFFRSCEKH